ncbi:MAG: trigger factor, partial [Planctomycetes bacterium]|nr:trigger factor [Planctomycetota bacterium]
MSEDAALKRGAQGRTMNVTVDEQDKLKRKITIEVPSSDVQAAYEEVYAQINSNLRINGFRPGKFPKHLAEKRFLSLMSGEAMQNLVPKYFQQALSELDVRPATEPKFDNLEIEKKKPFKFQVEFEIVPTVKLLAPSAFKLTEKIIKVAPKDVEERIEELRKTRGAFEDKGDQPAQKDDWVTFDFQGTRDGEPFEGGSGENQRIEVGSSQFLPDFDKHFTGIKAGESKTFDLTFPEDYGEASLAGQPVQFHITANKVEKKVPATLDKEFFSQFGAFEELDPFREHLQSQLIAEQERAAMQENQTALTDQIRVKYDFDVPESLVEQSLANFEHQLSH